MADCKPPFIFTYLPLRLNEFLFPADLVQNIKRLLEADLMRLLIVGGNGSGKSSLLDAIVREYYTGYSMAEYQSNVMVLSNIKEQGIQYYRNEVATFVQSISTIRGKKRIIVIDDLDTIPDINQVLLRNYMDTYMNKIHVIASCIQQQKINSSILSYLFVFRIPLLTNSDLNTIADRIIQSERIPISAEAKHQIISMSHSSAKMMIQYLEKAKLYRGPDPTPIPVHIIKDMCSTISTDRLERYMDQVIHGNVSAAVQTILGIHADGFAIIDIIDAISTYIKHTPLSDVSEDTLCACIGVVARFLYIAHNVHEDDIELVFMTNQLFRAISHRNLVPPP